MANKVVKLSVHAVTGRAFARFVTGWIAQVVVLVLAYLFTSDVVYALAHFVRALLGGAPDVPQPVPPWNLSFAWGIGTYGAVHWALMAGLTFPVFLLAAMMWTLLGRRWPAQAVASRGVAWAIALGSLAFGLRTVMLEFDVALASPRSFFRDIVFTGESAMELGAFCIGLLSAWWLIQLLSPPMRFAHDAAR